MKKQWMKIVSQKEIATDIYELIVEGDLVQSITSPGQFVHIKVTAGTEPLLRRPISICDFNGNKNQMKMIYRKDGKGTTLLSEKVAGNHIDVLGPLGNGFPVEEARKGGTALLVGGGIGVPPLYNLAKSLTENGVNVITVLGFQGSSAAFYSDEFSTYGSVYVATVDGSMGTKGFVTDIIKQENLSFDLFYACGPTPMLRALEQNYQEHKGYLSLEERMGCGIGACFACVCHVQDDPSGFSYRKVCSDGPVFSIGEVVL